MASRKRSHLRVRLLVIVGGACIVVSSLLMSIQTYETSPAIACGHSGCPNLSSPRAEFSPVVWAPSLVFGLLVLAGAFVRGRGWLISVAGTLGAATWGLIALGAFWILPPSFTPQLGYVFGSPGWGLFEATWGLLFGGCLVAGIGVPSLYHNELPRTPAVKAAPEATSP